MEGQKSWYSDSYEENSKNIWIYAHIPMFWGQNSRVHVSMGLKVTYSNKQGFLGMKLETSKYIISPWGLKSLQSDREGHKYVINHVW